MRCLHRHRLVSVLEVLSVLDEPGQKINLCDDSHSFELLLFSLFSLRHDSSRVPFEEFAERAELGVSGDFNKVCTLGMAFLLG